MNEIVVSVERMKKDERAAAELLTPMQARYFVDEYYARQEDRIRSEGRVRSMTESGEPCQCVEWLGLNSRILEDQIKGMLDRYSKAHPVGLWLRSIKGIGPVLAAGFLANLDINRIDKETGALECTTAGHFWHICGLDPSLDSEGFRRDRRIRGRKLSYNPSMKRLAWLAGESFKRLGKETEDDEPGSKLYRVLYDRRKEIELANNEAGRYAEQAAQALTEKKFGEDTLAIAAYRAGKLPLARIDRRACRWATKIFLSHLHEVWWKLEHADLPYPKPYAIGIMGHVDYIPPPNLHLVGLAA